jgi:hypothetical protein
VATRIDRELVKMDPEQEYREEAERLAQLPVEVQLQVLDIHRSTADNRKLSKRDQDAARERVEALERYLGLEPLSRAKPV